MMISATAPAIPHIAFCLSSFTALSYQDSGVCAKFLDEGLFFLGEGALHCAAHSLPQIVVIAAFLRDNVYDCLNALGAGLGPEKSQQLNYRVWFTSSLRRGNDPVIHASRPRSTPVIASAPIPSVRLTLSFSFTTVSLWLVHPKILISSSSLCDIVIAWNGGLPAAEQAPLWSPAVCVPHVHRGSSISSVGR